MEQGLRDETARRKVNTMSAQQGGSQPDLYAILGIARDASREQVIQAWRRRARAEHPDFRPDDDAAPARFQALAEAYRVLADPGRRAAYDRASGYQPGAPVAPPQHAPGQPGAGRGRSPAGRAAVTPVAGAPVAPLRAGPVRIEPLPSSPGADPHPDEDAVLAELLLRYLARRRPW